MKAASGRRALITIPRYGAGKRLILSLPSGRIAVWESPTGVSSMDGATTPEGQPLSVEDLRKAPRTFCGLYKGKGETSAPVCRFLGAFVPSDVVEGGDDGGAEKFRAYHHFGTRSFWTPCTDKNKREIRDFLYSPPPEPWVCAIGDGKKHVVLFTRPGDGAAASMRLRDSQIDYTPDVLRSAVSAAATLRGAGANEDDLRTGTYISRPSLELLRAARALDAEIDRLRGTPLIDLVIYLHNIADTTDGETEIT